MKTTFDPIENALTPAFTVKGRGISWTSDLERLLDHRLKKLERRFPGRFQAVGVSLEDVNGPRGGVDKRCRLNFVLKHHGPLSVCADASKPQTAIAQAADRAAGVIVRRVLRGRDRRGGPVAA
jgi:hypothetical protein